MTSSLVRTWVLLSLVVTRWLDTSPVPATSGAAIDVAPGELQRAADGLRRPDGTLPPGTELRLLPGVHRLTAQAWTDSTCGNCEDPNTPVEATVGLVLSGQSIAVTGRGPHEVTIETHAGYGILFQDCAGCRLTGVTVTGGIRDLDPNATDAGIVVKRSAVTVDDCEIRENLGDPDIVRETVVGVIGIAGREGSDLRVRKTRVIRNSWDGIALYRGARAEVEHCVIDGVDKARGKTIGGGRGVGIGVTWNARAELRANRVTRYWKGIGIFVDAAATVERNVVEEVLTWGIALWDAGKGEPSGRIADNVIYDAGACGISVTRSAHSGAGDASPGYLTGNLVLKTGQEPRYDDPEYYCPQAPIARMAVPESFPIHGNLLWQNRRVTPPGAEGEPLLDPDLEWEDFAPAARKLLESLAAEPALVESRAVRELLPATRDEGPRPD